MYGVSRSVFPQGTFTSEAGAPESVEEETNGRGAASLLDELSRVMDAKHAGSCVKADQGRLCAKTRGLWSGAVNAREMPPENLDNDVFSCCGFYAIKSTVIEANRHAILDPLKTKGL